MNAKPMFEPTPQPPMPGAMDVETLAFKLATADSDLQLIDVREPWELEKASLPGFLNFPLSQFEQWATTLTQVLSPDVETVVLCHHGVRSAQMCYWLCSQGFTQVKNVTGGIDAFSLRVNQGIPRY